MLKQLTIRNYALIDELEINFADDLNIITGETGAGKSIILGALSLILGQRADSKSLYQQDIKCIVEGAFEIGSYRLQDFFSYHDLDYESTTHIRREITPAGKSRAFVNDTPVNLSILKELGARLINLHSQHETLSLNTSSFQLELVDVVAGNAHQLKEFSTVFKRYRDTQDQLETLIAQFESEHGDIDYLNFQLGELAEADLQINEDKELDAELSTLDHAESIKENLGKAVQALSDGEPSITSMLHDVISVLRQIAPHKAELEELSSRVESTSIELDDITKELEHIAQSTNYDPERIELVTDRLNLLNRLMAKHQKQDVEELMELQESLEQKISSFDQIRDQIDSLKAAIAKDQIILEEIGAQLTEARKTASPKIEEEVRARLEEVGMPNAELSVVISPLPIEKIHEKGLDHVQFLFTANKGRQLQQLKQVASGGELSRLMLILKSLIAENSALPTLIFDEIDTGISGEIAYKVGQLLQALGKHHQVISITHQPQIASKGSNHFFVYKDTIDDQTFTRIKKLQAEERMTEIAKMLGGENVTTASLENAKELLLN